MDKKRMDRIRLAVVNAMGQEEHDPEMETFRAEVPPWIVLKLMWKIEELQRKLNKMERRK
jgi:hypothetical protein